MNGRRLDWAILAAGALVVGALVVAVPLGAASPGPVARAAVPGVRSVSARTIARGVKIIAMTIANRAVRPSWTVTLEKPEVSKVTGAPAVAEVGSRSWARATAGRLRAGGFRPRVVSVRWPHYADTQAGLMGYRVRVGSFATPGAAANRAAAISADGFADAVEWTGYDAQRPPTLEHVHIADINPGLFTGRVEGTHGGRLAQRQTPSSVAARLRSLVAVNGGFFVTSGTDGIEGTESGAGAYGGILESMASGARGALIIGNNGHSFRIANLSTQVTVRVGTASHAVQGISRVPGIVRDCGRPGGTPTAHPEQDIDCFEASDLVVFTHQLGAALPTGAGTQVVVDAAGKVIKTGPRGGQVRAGDTVLQGIGSAATWLTRHAQVGRAVAIARSIRDAATGRPIHLGPHGSIISAAPILLRHGRIDIDAAAEGVVDAKDLSFGYQWADVRQPRTIVGVTARGDLLLVTVDGRQAGGSEGFTLYEEAVFMRSLGAVDALNLDGGGSTAMTVRGRLVNDPSDGTERPVGDTIQVLR